MDYNKQVKEIVSYIRAGEKDERDFRIGVEFEHFVIDKDTLETISYYGKGGVEESLKELEARGWQGTYEGEYLLGLKNEDKVISLEPGSQLEFSVLPQKSLLHIEREYLNFLEEIIPILERKNQGLITIGYHPVTKIDDIKILPKKRYSYMFEYFRDKGFRAHNMMKGTASLQMAIDYSSEEDYIKKFKIANGLSPILYAMFDNGFYFEGKRWEKYSLRSHIWENCDKDRCGIVEGTFDRDYGYEKYAQYILNRPPIFIDNGRKMYYTGNKLVREIFDPENYSLEELEHILTMFFPDVRTKKFIEIRMIDAIPYPYNLSAVALLKGILYDKDNMDRVYEFIKDIDMEDIKKSKSSIHERGLDGKLKNIRVYELGKWIVDLAKAGLDEEEVKYILPLEKMIMDKKNPYRIIEERDHLGKKEALNWCILNNLVEVN